VSLHRKVIKVVDGVDVDIVLEHKMAPIH